MASGADSSLLQPTNREETAGDKAVQDGSGQVWSNGFVTEVTRLRGLLKAAREALAMGELERADRVLSETQRLLSRLHTRPGSIASQTS